jgi:hypothetical protein
MKTETSEERCKMEKERKDMRRLKLRRCGKIRDRRRSFVAREPTLRAEMCKED